MNGFFLSILANFLPISFRVSPGHVGRWVARGGRRRRRRPPPAERGVEERPFHEPHPRARTRKKKTGRIKQQAKEEPTTRTTSTPTATAPQRKKPKKVEEEEEEEEEEEKETGGVTRRLIDALSVDPPRRAGRHGNAADLCRYLPCACLAERCWKKNQTLQPVAEDLVIAKFKHRAILEWNVKKQTMHKLCRI